MTPMGPVVQVVACPLQISAATALPRLLRLLWRAGHLPIVQLAEHLQLFAP